MFYTNKTTKYSEGGCFFNLYPASPLWKDVQHFGLQTRALIDAINPRGAHFVRAVGASEL